MVRRAWHRDAGGRMTKPEFVVVTGAGSGIGRATALAFAKDGARVAICDIRADRIAELAAELGDRAAVAKQVDVSDRAQMAAFADEVHRIAPAADVIVNNAGVGLGGSFVETTLDNWDWVLGINLKGVVHGCHYFVPKMIERGAGGHVVNVSSVFGLYAAPYASAYVATKFAVLGMSRSLRGELAPHGIGVTAICPGMIATSIVEDGRTSGQTTQHRAKIIERFRERGTPPSVVADAIVDAVRTNPAVRPVGRDGWVLAAMLRLAPAAAYRVGAAVSRRFR
jgi:NADP-dependent 3-hydroxy acid dehydrogenase YdfG